MAADWFHVATPFNCKKLETAACRPLTESGFSDCYLKLVFRIFEADSGAHPCELQRFDT
jgi:hypothetical protein